MPPPRARSTPDEIGSCPPSGDRIQPQSRWPKSEGHTPCRARRCPRRTRSCGSAPSGARPRGSSVESRAAHHWAGSHRVPPCVADRGCRPARHRTEPTGERSGGAVGHRREPTTPKGLLGGRRTPAMVQRYAHLAPERVARAIERLVVSSAAGAVEPRPSFDGTSTGASAERADRLVLRRATCYGDRELFAEGWPSPVEGVRLEIG